MEKTTSQKNQPAGTSARAFFSKQPGDAALSGGQQEVNSFFAPSSVQASLAVGSPDDPYEKEAEKVSQQVAEQYDVLSGVQPGALSSPLAATLIQPMLFTGRINRRMQRRLQNAPFLQTKCAGCEKEEEEEIQSSRIQRSANGNVVSPSIEKQINESQGKGQPIDAGPKAVMETSFGADFSGVRIHTDSASVQMSSDLGAHAFTVGNDIHFNEGKYQPHTKEGLGLLAHELTHTIQQGASVQSKRINRLPQSQLFSNPAMGHMSFLRGDSMGQAALYRKEIAQFQKEVPEEDMLRQQQQILQSKEVDKVQMKDNAKTLRKCPSDSGTSGPAPAPPPAATAATVSIADVNSPNTPTGTKRIIPRKDTDVAVTVTGATAAAPVILSFDGAGGGNGTATVNGGATHTLTSTETVKLKGVNQTDPGKANNLKLVAKQGTSTLAQSNAFSVAAYPIEIGFNFNRKMEGEAFPTVPGSLFWGAAYDLTFKSDSGTNADCNKTKISENIINNTGTGFWAGVASTTSGFNRTTAAQTDHHADGAANAAAMKARIDAADPASTFVAHQFFRFSCERTNIAESKTTSPKVPTSGFKISETLSKYFFHLKKEGFANNAVAAGTVDDPSIKNIKVT